MKNSKLISLSVFGVLSLSACMQPTSNARSSGIISHTAGPQTLVADRVDILSAFLQKSGIDVLFAELTTTSGDSRLAR